MTFGRGLRALSIASAVLITGAFALVFFYAPERRRPGLHPEDLLRPRADGDRGAVRVRRRRDLRDPAPAHGRPAHDLRSYVAIHISLILGVGVLVTGAIWAKAAWGHWWVWDEPTLVSFLIVFLLYACYQPLRFSIEDPERQARYARVFAIVAGAFVPLNFLAVRMAESLTHPRVLSRPAARCPARCGSRSSSRSPGWPACS